MKAAIRMISVATALFWIFLAAFTISAVYSFIKDVRFGFGELEMSTNLTEQNEMVLCLPITVENKGLFNIGFFNITTEISSVEGDIIARGNTCIPIIGRNTIIAIRHNITVNVAELFQEKSNLIFNDTTFVLYEAVSMSVAEVIPFAASTNVTIPWGAPLYNLNIGEPERVVNGTHTLIRMLINFENHSFFDVAGNLSIRIYNLEGAVINETQTFIEAPSSTFYSDYAEIGVEGTAVPLRLEFYLQTPIFNVKIGEINLD